MGRAHAELGGGLQAPNSCKGLADVPAEQEIELGQQPHIVFKNSRLPLPFVLHGEGKGLIPVIPANSGQGAALAVGDVA